tara:strand:+ start:10790 stop:11344 length:555 start_codon:yes stop_codon:yes gene_type:complete
MANETDLFVRDGSITQEKVIAEIKDINNSFFAGKLPITVEDNFITIGWSDKSQDGFKLWVEEDFEYHNWELYDTDGYEPEIIKGSYLTIRHGHGEKWFWWLDFLFLHELANRFNGTLEGEGYDRENKPEKYKWKSFREYVMNPFVTPTQLKLIGHRHWVKDIIRWTKQIIDDELFDIAWKLKIK